MGDREDEKKKWELAQCKLVVLEINRKRGTDYEAEPSKEEPADVALVSRSKKYPALAVQVVSIPLDFRHRDDKHSVEKIKGTLRGLLKERKIKGVLVGVIQSGTAEMHGIKPALLEVLAEIISKDARESNLEMGYAEIYERSNELAELVHHIFVSHHDVIAESEVDIPAGSAVPADGQWIEEGILKKVAKYGTGEAVKDLMLVIGVAGFVDDQQIEAFQANNPPDTLPFSEVWIVTPFHGVVCLKQ